jgi:hypothetical protein
MKTLLPVAAILLSGCFYGNEDDWADAEQIVEAASRCGLADFEPTPAGAAFAAYVPSTVPDAQAKEDCIYRDLERQGLLATR